jgi:hypothetical protein
VSRRRRTRTSSSAEATAKTKAKRSRDVFVPRPFAGLAGEADWVALRELVPAATSPVRLAPELTEKYGDRSVIVATVLSMAMPAVTKPDGRVLLGLQRNARSGDLSHDLAVALMMALEADPGSTVELPPPTPTDGPRLQQILADGALDVTVRDGFEFWLDENADANDPEVTASLERANASIYPTVKLEAAPAAYWCRVPGRAHVRWVLPQDEELALAALARLAAAGGLLLGDGTKFAGMFRAHGLLVPVWDLPSEPDAPRWEEAVRDLAGRYAQALTVSGELSPAERRARQGLISRQLTLR